MSRLDRRSFLGGTLVLPVAALGGGRVLGGAGDAPRNEAAGFPGLIVRQSQPDNLEMPFPTLDRFLVPNERFYVRSHFAVPSIDRTAWRLRVEGAVERPFELTYDELRRLPTRTATVLLECAGNGRVFITPRAEGLPWELGAVGTAEWTGVPLAALLDRAGVRESALEVLLEGADAGEVRPHPSPYASPGRINYARSLPLAKARQDVLLAHRMNGVDLPAAHGFPLRAVVPAWYGMASTKWLTRVVVTDRPFRGFFQTQEYAYYERQHGQPSLTALTELAVKSLIARPMRGEVVPAGRPYRVHGAAWTGDGDVTAVEVSVDGGRTWSPARLLGQSVRHAWRLWEYSWQASATAGPVTLMCRATDSRGRTQPASHDPDRRNVMVNFTLPMPVEVR